MSTDGEAVPRTTSLPELYIPINAEHIRAIIAEFIGTTLFLWSSTMAVTASRGEILMIATSFGLTLAVCIAMTGPISGGHINPAVTLSMIVTRNISAFLGLFYIIAQLAGAAFGTGISYVIATSLKGALEVSAMTNTGGAFLAETFGTFVLVMTVFATAVQTSVGPQTNDKVAVRAQAPLLIGISVWTVHLALIGYTGCGINPARWFGPALILNVWNSNSWVYVIGPISGALAASLAQLGLSGCCRPDTPVNSVTSPKPHSP